MANNKRNKIILGVVLIIMISVVLINLIKTYNLLPSKDNFLNSSTKTSSSSIEKENNSINVSVVTEAKTDSPALYQLEKTVKINNIVYTIKKVTVSKEVGELPVPQSYPSYVQINDDGLLVGEQSYVFLELSIANQIGADKVISLNNATLNVLPNEDDLKDFITQGDIGLSLPYGFNEPVTMNVNVDKIDQKDYYAYTLKKDETLEFTIGYIIKDNAFDQPYILYTFNPQGINFAMSDGEIIKSILINDLLKNSEDNK